MKVLAPAKLNLFLEILGKYPDGYHRINTVYQTIDLFDELDFSLLEHTNNNSENSSFNPVTIEIDGLQSDLVPTDSSNLISRAAKLFFKKAEIHKKSLNVRLLKRIPVAGGTAGGSSDAAATLYFLNKAFENVLTENELLRLAQELGSDVPFCLLGGRMTGTGRGDQLLRLPNGSEILFVVIFPPPQLLLSSKAMYIKYDKMGLERNKPRVSFEKFVSFLNSYQIDEIKENLFNSLEEAAISANYWVETAKSALTSKGFVSLVSGSGPTIFTIVKNRKEGENLVEELQKEGYSCSLHKSIANSFS